jgi:hypothetical protein
VNVAFDGSQEPCDRAFLRCDTPRPRSTKIYRGILPAALTPGRLIHAIVESSKTFDTTTSIGQDALRWAPDAEQDHNRSSSDRMTRAMSESGHDTVCVRCAPASLIAPGFRTPSISSDDLRTRSERLPEEHRKPPMNRRWPLSQLRHAVCPSVGRG